MLILCLLLLIWLLSETQEAAEEKPLEGSINRGMSFCQSHLISLYSLHILTLHTMLSHSSSDAVLTRVATEKRLSLIKAWEESEKSIADNK